MMGRVAGKVALVTGGASGIGRATAIMLSGEGAQVIVSDASDRDRERVISEVGASAIFMQHDVTDDNQWSQVMAVIRDRFGRLDILVNSAGITGIPGPQNPENATLELWRQVMQVNMEGAFLGCQYAIGIMKDTVGGAIVNVSSLAGITPTPGAIAYGASKASLSHYSKSVALYCAQSGYHIRCNCILPGAIRTPIWDGFLGEGDDRQLREEQIRANIPMGVWGEPSDIAHAVVFLASDESKFVTGAELVIDGGQALNGN